MVVRYPTAQEAVAGIQSGQRVYVHGASAFPQSLITALVARGEELYDVEIVHLHTNGAAPYVDERYRGHFHHRALFVGPNTREAVDSGRATYVPIFLSDVPQMFRSGHLPLDVVLVQVSPPDSHGFCSLGTSVDCIAAAFEAATIRIAQINPQMPRTHGDSFIPLDRLTGYVEIDEPLQEFHPRPPDQTQLAIAEQLAALIPDGATLQLGIGGIPDAVCRALVDRKDLGIHSEVISDGVIDLVERGVITGSRKTINRGKIVVAFLNGTRRLFDFADDNPMLEMRSIDYTNNTRIILQLDDMIAINSALEIDLTGQVCAESIGPRIYSGVGGQMDFLRGAALARGGKPIVALASTARGGTVSRIVPTLQAGAGVTTSRAHVHYVATEFGVVNLHGRDLAERARALIGIAHPSFRDDLECGARELRLLPGF
ncbi:MAG TPA: acetyl-CoA hydrolase/transferase C-terminal domain-containing protein [Chloroflexota bacterium]|nr:acetyl-CoA hydrolase/transferase C-terminal domain-containing protein [Chloroflexota bacterium]